MSRKHGHGGSTTDAESRSGGPKGGSAGKRRRGAGGDRSRHRADRPRRRNERGQYVEQMTRGEILDLFERLPGPVIATADVAEHFDTTTEGARRKLNDLCEDGLLDRRKVGGTRVYWRNGKGGT
ncbi:MAG: hypothetical protein ACLFNC_01980 [Halodesulfurarchaeum sp.]